MASLRGPSSKALLDSETIHSTRALYALSSSAAASAPARTGPQNGESSTPRTAIRRRFGEALMGRGRLAAMASDSMTPLPVFQNEVTLAGVIRSMAVSIRDFGGCQPATR